MNTQQRLQEGDSRVLMKLQQWQQEIRLIVTGCVLCLTSGMTLANEALHDTAFAEIKRNVQSELDERYKAAQGSGEIFPGATVAFGLPDGRIAEYAVGFSDIEKRIAMSPDSRMPSGSTGKMFVAAVTLDMAADGLLDLDDKIGKWLHDEPWFERLPNSKTITLRQLMNHSSGLIDHVFDTESAFQEYVGKQVSADNPGHTIDPRDMVQFVLDREPLFAAGEGIHYSDTNYILLGLIIEKVSESTYYEELTRRLLVPLTLEMTAPLERQEIEGLAQGYAPESQQLFGLPYEVVVDGALVFDPSIEWTGGGLVSSSHDLVRWTMELFEGKAIPQQYLDEMLNSIAVPEHFDDDPGRSYGYGLGVNIAHTKFGPAYRHGGFFPGYNSIVAYFPDSDVAVAMQINTDRSAIEEHFDALVEIIIDGVSGNALR